MATSKYFPHFTDKASANDCICHPFQATRMSGTPTRLQLPVRHHHLVQPSQLNLCYLYKTACLTIVVFENIDGIPLVFEDTLSYNGNTAHYYIFTSSVNNHSPLVLLLRAHFFLSFLRFIYLISHPPDMPFSSKSYTFFLL